MSSQPLFKVIKTGLLTTFQDLGREGYQQFGVPVSGAMDPFALQAANLLAVNNRAEAALEITIMGPELEILSPITAAICGGDLQPKVNDRPASMWQSLQLKEGDRVTFGIRKTGMRSYLAVAAGFDIPTVMGSKSRYEIAGLGQKISKRDTIYGLGAKEQPVRRLDENDIPEYKESATLRVIKGPHEGRFTKEGLKNFYNEEHQVTTHFNRMAYRFKSTPISSSKKGDIWTEPVSFGTVQVPDNGQPILLMADRQTTGGYPIIANVISVDLYKAAQLAPGDTVRFQKVDIKEAQYLYEKREQFFLKMETTLLTP